MLSLDFRQKQIKKKLKKERNMGKLKLVERKEQEIEHA